MYIHIYAYTYIYIYIYIYILPVQGPSALGPRAVQRKIKVGSREYPTSPSVKEMKFAVTPLVLTPFVPFRALSHCIPIV